MLHRRAGEAAGPATHGDSERGARTPLAFVLRTRKYWCILAARSCSDAAWYFYLFWLPGYFQEARGLSLETVGRLLWIPYLAAGVGAVAGAWFEQCADASRLQSRPRAQDRAASFGGAEFVGGAVLLCGGFQAGHRHRCGRAAGASIVVLQHPHRDFGNLSARNTWRFSMG